MKTLSLLIVIPVILLAGSNPKTAVAVRTSNAPIIDGSLDEAEWRRAVPASGFLQQDPQEGAPASERTEVRFLYDDDALYIGCMMYDSDPSNIVARLARRDDEIESDIISIRLDTFHDQQTNYEFTINAAGVKVDILQFSDGRKEDLSWDAVWDVHTQITAEGWAAEIRIPFRALRFADTQEQEWGLNLIRRITRRQERDYWALIRKNESGLASRFGHLRGIAGIPSVSHVEVLPYAVGSLKTTPPSPAFPNGREWKGNAGFDAKYRPSGGLTIDATFNPDFGQVEADPAVLNLSTFETFYPEKRPFFVEGSQILQFETFGEGSGLFYSRRIGRSIRATAPAGGVALSDPRFTTILGAAKISGKVANGLSLGILEAVTDMQHMHVRDSLGVEETQTVEPMANYSVVRLRQDVLENSNIGVILTGVQRRGRTPAFTGGVDWLLRMQENEYRVEGFIAAARSAPDGEWREGAAGKCTFAKDGGDHWRWSFEGDFTTPRYYINDLGFFRRPNDYGVISEVVYLQTVPGTWYRGWDVDLAHHLRRNFDGAQLNNGLTLSGELTFANYWTVELKGEMDRGLYDDRETRGNGLFRKPESRSIQAEIQSDPRNSVVGKLECTGAADDRGANAAVLEAVLELRPSHDLTLQFSLLHSQRWREWAWMANVDDAGIAPVPISLFAERTTREWDLTTRGSFMFTRDLTLQMYLQIFNAQGTFAGSARMTAPGSFVPYTYAHDDFNELALNSNLVLRWEYLPGSTMYLVWSHARAGEHGRFGSSLGENLADVWTIPADNVVMLKLSYWMSY